jgi:hypothetical protein
MSFLKEPSIRDIVFTHVFFAVIAAVVMLLPSLAAGWKLLALVIVYNVIIPVVAFTRGHSEWLNIWLFVVVISIMQVIPDWFLSAQLNVLVFPTDGSPMIGTVPVYMAGLWSIPLFALVYVGCRIEEKRSQLAALAAIMFMSVLVFGVSEATMWTVGSWYAQNVAMLGHVAIYVMVPEAVLGGSTYALFSMIRTAEHWRKIFWGYVIMVIYLGNSALFYFLVERVVLGS